MSVDLTQREIDEIKAEAEEKYPDVQHISSIKFNVNEIRLARRQTYCESVTAERKRAKVLVEALQSIIEKREHRSSDIYDIATTSINTYNKPQP